MIFLKILKCLLQNAFLLMVQNVLILFRFPFFALPDSLIVATISNTRDTLWTLRYSLVPIHQHQLPPNLFDLLPCNSMQNRVRLSRFSAVRIFAYVS